MVGVDLFHWLVEYHTQFNLAESLPYIRNGKGYAALRESEKFGASVSEKLLQEGSDKDQHYTGLLIVANGSTLFDRLYEDKIILDEETDLSVSVPVKELFFSYLINQQYNDGAYVFNGTTQEITRVYELNNNPDSLSKKLRLDELLPADFVFQKGKQVFRHDLGTKTRLAIKLPHAYNNCRTFQIKQSAYTPLGMGKATHFDLSGLVEEFFFRYAPDNDGPFIDEQQKIIGVHKKYENKEGKIVGVSEEVWDPKKKKGDEENIRQKEEKEQTDESCGLEKCVNC